MIILNIKKGSGENSFLLSFSIKLTLIIHCWGKICAEFLYSAGGLSF
jgi:hypothetical protein